MLCYGGTTIFWFVIQSPTTASKLKTRSRHQCCLILFKRYPISSTPRTRKVCQLGYHRRECHHDISTYPPHRSSYMYIIFYWPFSSCIFFIVTETWAETLTILLRCWGFHISHCPGYVAELRWSRSKHRTYCMDNCLFSFYHLLCNEFCYRSGTSTICHDFRSGAVLRMFFPPSLHSAWHPKVSCFLNQAVSSLSTIALSLNWLTNFSVSLLFLPLRNLLSGGAPGDPHHDPGKIGRVFWVFAAILALVMSVVWRKWKV